MENNQKPKVNYFKRQFENIKNTRKNIKIIQASPYARMALSMKVRKWVIAILIPWIIYLGYRAFSNMPANGIAGTFGRMLSLGIIIYICYRIYSTIPQQKKMIEYYKKYPHTINYCPEDTKETVDSILAKFNKNEKEVDKNGISDIKKEIS